MLRPCSRSQLRPKRDWHEHPTHDPHLRGRIRAVSLALGAPASPLFASADWLWFTAFVGANLFQSGLTRFCPLETILKRVGVPEAWLVGA
jgi:hypothetical protein